MAVLNQDRDSAVLLDCWSRILCESDTGPFRHHPRCGRAWAARPEYARELARRGRGLMISVGLLAATAPIRKAANATVNAITAGGRPPFACTVDASTPETWGHLETMQLDRWPRRGARQHIRRDRPRGDVDRGEDRRVRHVRLD